VGVALVDFGFASSLIVWLLFLCLVACGAIVGVYVLLSILGTTGRGHLPPPLRHSRVPPDRVQETASHLAQEFTPPVQFPVRAKACGCALYETDFGYLTRFCRFHKDKLGI
jgi:hypothetical protein